MFGSFKSHLAKTYYWRYSVTNDIYIILCHYLLYCYKDLVDLHYKHQNFLTSDLNFWSFKYQHLQQIASFLLFALFESLNTIELLLTPYYHYIRQYES